MTRKKVKLSYITNDTARKATFKKRKKGLLKKLTELGTLCDVEACAVIYSPYDAQPEVHPSHQGVQRALGRLRKMPEMDQSKKMVNQEGFLRQRLAKAVDQLKKLRKENREREMTRLMLDAVASPAAAAGLRGLSAADLGDLAWVIDQNIKDVANRIERLARAKKKKEAEEEEEKKKKKEQKQPAPAPAPAPEEAVAAPPGWSGAWKMKPGPSIKVPERKTSEVAAAGAVAARGGGRPHQQQQWFMELMMNHQNHHEEQIMNMVSRWGDNNNNNNNNNDRVFP